jgi:hypothetical protein
MADVNTSILTALEAGYHPQEIMDHIKNSEDPSHQEWYSNYSANMADRAKEQSAGSIYYNDGSGVVSQENKTTKPSSVSTPLLDFAKNLTPAELAAAGFTTIAAIKGPGLYNAYQDRKIEKEKLSIEQRRLNAYEQQVTKQGMTPEPVTTVAGQPQGDKLSPLDEARIATERAKAEHIQSKIAIAERAATLKEEQAKARASKQPATGAATAPTGIVPPTGPTPINPTVPLNTEVGKAPKEMPMVEQGLANKEINAVAEGRKQAVPPPSKSVVDISGLTKEEAGMKKYLTSFYGGGIPGEQAYEKTIEILGARPSYEPGKGGGLTPEQNKVIKDWRKENVQGPKVNLTKDMKSAIRSGAGLAILAAIPGFAEAKNLRQAAGNVAEGLLPIGLTPSELASGTLTEKQLNAYKEAQKLGSPYRSVPPPR